MQCVDLTSMILKPLVKAVELKHAALQLDEERVCARQAPA